MKSSITLGLVLHHYAVALTTLFPLVNPFSTVPLFLSLTARLTAQERRRQARRACLNAAAIMIITLLIGQLMLSFLNISLYSLRIAGGLVVAFIGFNLLFPKPLLANTAHPLPELDPTLIPLAFPSLSGAGTIFLILNLSTTLAGQSSWTWKLAGYGIGFATIATVALLSWAVLSAATGIAKKLGRQGLEAMTRVMGLLMMCMGIEFVANGIKGYVDSLGL